MRLADVDISRAAVAVTGLELPAQLPGEQIRGGMTVADLKYSQAAVLLACCAKRVPRDGGKGCARRGLALVARGLVTESGRLDELRRRLEVFLALNSFVRRLKRR